MSEMAYVFLFPADFSDYTDFYPENDWSSLPTW